MLLITLVFVTNTGDIITEIKKHIRADIVEITSVLANGEKASFNKEEST
ncbi:MAG: hypothetical protein ACPLX8_01350 [Nanopusillaceae archaeon]